MAASQLSSAPSVADHQADTYAARLLLAEQIIGFRIMKQTEIAPGWWGQAIEVGETGSATVAYNFCREQNRVTMNLNRSKMIQFFAEPIYAEQADAATEVA